MPVIQNENRAIAGAISCAAHPYKEMVTHTKNGTREVDVVGASMRLDAMRSMSTLPWIHDDLHLQFEQAGPGAGQTPEQYPTGVIAMLKATGDTSDLQLEPFSLVPHHQGDKGPTSHFTLTPL